MVGAVMVTRRHATIPTKPSPPHLRRHLGAPPQYVLRPHLPDPHVPRPSRDRATYHRRGNRKIASAYGVLEPADRNAPGNTRSPIVAGQIYFAIRAHPNGVARREPSLVSESSPWPRISRDQMDASCATGRVLVRLPDRLGLANLRTFARPSDSRAIQPRRHRLPTSATVTTFSDIAYVAPPEFASATHTALVLTQCNLCEEIDKADDFGVADFAGLPVPDQDTVLAFTIRDREYIEASRAVI